MSEMIPDPQGKSDLKLPNLRTLQPSPSHNPLIEPKEIKTRKRQIKTASRTDLLDPETGEIKGASIIHLIEIKDDMEFVKVFAEGVRRAFGLSKTGYRVFQTVLDQYQREKMTGGYADCVRLFWFNDGLDGEKLDMSEKTFQRGLKELIANGFLYPRTHELFWINPALFFKGDRVRFVTEYQKRSSLTTLPEGNS